MAANSDGVWNQQPATLAFVKEHHLYETWRVRTLLAAILAGGAWLAYRQRVARLHDRYTEVLAERNRIARELHDTVEQGLTGHAAARHRAIAWGRRVPPSATCGPKTRTGPTRPMPCGSWP